jgi:DNA polymerase III subunit gamma/tau
MSEQYRALTRKYRPIHFGDIVSQEHVSNTLQNAIEQNRLAHAYLFCGPRGVGKTTMARVLARTINEVDADVDGEMLSNTLNIVEIDAASNNGVDDVRALRERVRIPPQNGRYKVYIIDEVHMLSKQAFNALLKTLEEPPAHAIFIFATTEPHKVLPTILSRCQRFDFRRIKVDEIVDRLSTIAKTEQITIDEESLHVVARKADGALRDALGILDQVIAFCGTDIRHADVLRALNVVGTDILFELTRAITDHDSAAGMRLIDRVLLDGHDIQEFLIGLTEHFRNLYFAREADNLSLIETSAEMKARYKEVGASFSEDDLMRMLHITSEAQYKIRDAHQPRIQLEVTILKLIRMERSEGLARLMQEIRELQEAIGKNGARAVTGDVRAEKLAATPKPVVKSQPSAPTKPGESGRSGVENPAASSTGQSGPGRSGRSGQPASRTMPSGEEQSLFGTPSISGTRNRLSAVPREDVVISASVVGDEGGEESGYAVSGSLALASRPRAEVVTAEDAENAEDDAEGDVDTAESTDEQADPVGDDSVDEPAGSGAMFLHDIRKVWESYLGLVRTRSTPTVFFAMQNTEPVDVREGEITLQCPDMFSLNLIQENRREMQECLKSVSGRHFRFHCILREQKEQDKTAADPYARFRELQQKDPRIKTIVDLFGAELEY